MKHKRILNIVLSLLLIICILLGSYTPYNANAEVIDKSTSWYRVKDSDGEVVLNVTMSGGIITIVAKSHAATTQIRYETIGLSFTRSAIPENTTTLGYTGPNSFTSNNVIMFNNAFNKTNDRNGDTVTTTIIFNAGQISKALDGETFENITKGTPIYMHAIFRTYENDTKATRSGNIRNWKDIMNAESWGPETLEGFKKYYNMEIEFMPAPQPNTLYYLTEDNTSLQEEKALASVLPNEKVTWKNEPAELPKDEKTCELIGYYVTKKTDKTQEKIVNHYIDDGYSLDKIQSGSTTVKLGGMNIFLIYREKDGPGGGDSTPTPTPPTPDPGARPIKIPEPETVYESMNSPSSSGDICADNRGSERFIVNQGVPTTESLFTQVNTTKYLLGYNLTKQVGVESYAVRVSKDYILQWTGKDAKGTKPMTETVTVDQVISIQRAYGYWEIMNFDLYHIGSATINNYALPGGSTTMTPAGYSPPNASVSHSSSKDAHIIPPAEVTNGMKLPSMTIAGTTNKPSIPAENFQNTADWMIPDLTVKNDSLVINGNVIMDSSPTKLEGPRVDDTTIYNIRTAGTEKCNDNVLYQPGQVIGATKKNGTYHSSGTVSYIRQESVNSNYTNTLQNDVVNLSSVVIHTPVYCEAVVGSNNDNYVQLLKPSAATQLVLDPDPTLNNFTLKISNTGPHSNKQGYYTRDFSRSLRDPNVSYIASSNGLLLNEVKFPIDVYINKTGGDEFIKKNTWIVIDRSTTMFYLPMWVQEDIYTVDCRTIAVNADMNKLGEISEQTRNTKLMNYVATDTFNLEVSGRIYGLTLYDVTDYPMWKEAFRVINSLDLKINDQDKYPDGTNKTTYSKGYSYNYTVGTNDQYGKDTGRKVKYTFPLVNGSHPFYKNIGVLKTGYAVRFKLDTIGTLYSGNSVVHIKPTFYYVDKNGKNRVAVDLYYEELIDGKNRKLVKMGNSLDQINLKYMEAGSPYTGIPTAEMKNTASILNMAYNKFIARIDAIFNFKDIRISSVFRTFINSVYNKSIISTDQYNKISSTGITQAMIMEQMQRWYGSYYIPNIVNAAPLGYDVYGYAAKYGINFKEKFWKNNGYIIVNFDIVTIDSYGKEHLSYMGGNNNMWQMEDAPLSKTDNNNITFHFEYGDFIMYDTYKSVQGDYSPGGIY